MRRPGEGQQVVLADRMEIDVADDHHLAVVIAGHGGKQLGGVGGTDTREDLFVHLGDAARRVDQPEALRIFPDAFEEEPDAPLYLVVVHVWAGASADVRSSRG